MKIVSFTMVNNESEIIESFIRWTETNLYNQERNIRLNVAAMMTMIRYH